MTYENHTYKRKDKCVVCCGKPKKDKTLESVFTKKEGDAHWCLLKRGKVMNDENGCWKE